MPTPSSSRRFRRQAAPASAAPWRPEQVGAGNVAKPYSLTVVEADDPLAEEARELEALEFEFRFGNTRELLDQMYEPYLEATHFVLVRDERVDLPVGMMRLVLNSDAGFPSVNSLAGSPWNDEPDLVLARSIRDFDADRTLDVAMIAVRRGWGSREPAALLFHELAHFSRLHDIYFWVTILNDTVLERMQLLGRPFERYIGVKPGPYAGSPSSTPVWGVHPDAVARLAKDNPGLYAWIVEGRGLTELVGEPAPSSAGS